MSRFWEGLRGMTKKRILTGAAAISWSILFFALIFTVNYATILWGAELVAFVAIGYTVFLPNVWTKRPAPKDIGEVDIIPSPEDIEPSIQESVQAVKEYQKSVFSCLWFYREGEEGSPRVLGYVFALSLTSVFGIMLVLVRLISLVSNTSYSGILLFLSTFGIFAPLAIAFGFVWSIKKLSRWSTSRSIRRLCGSCMIRLQLAFRLFELGNPNGNLSSPETASAVRLIRDQLEELQVTSAFSFPLAGLLPGSIITLGGTLYALASALLPSIGLSVVTIALDFVFSITAVGSVLFMLTAARTQTIERWAQLPSSSHALAKAMDDLIGSFVGQDTLQSSRLSLHIGSQHKGTNP